LQDDERHAGAGRHGGKEFGNRIQAAGRRAHADDLHRLAVP